MGLIDRLIKKKVDDTVKIYVPKLILCVIVGSALLILAIYLISKILTA